nr:hypothetical protein [Cytophagales bacterium]
MRVLNIEAEDYSREAQSIIESVADYSASAEISDCEVLIVRLARRIDADILDQLPSLKAMVTATTGLNHIDLEECERRNIAVLSLKGEEEFLKTITATAEHTIALMLNLIRSIPAASASVENGEWDRDQFKGYDLFGKTLGIIGYGRLGKLVKKYALAFGMNVLTYDIKPGDFVGLGTLLSQSDIVSLNASYVPENDKMIDSQTFNRMKKSAYFINTARGELVDEQALLDSLNSGQIAGAALDVLNDENNLNMKENPIIEYARSNRNLLITPHIGGATYDSMKKTEIFMAKKLKKFIEEHEV